MSSEPQPPDDPVRKGHPLRKVIWLLVALLPSAVALYIGTNGPAKSPDIAGLIRSLLVLNGVLSLAAAVGLVRGITEPVGRFFLGFFLWVFFFALNIIIVIAAACAPLLH